MFLPNFLVLSFDKVVGESPETLGNVCFHKIFTQWNLVKILCFTQLIVIREEIYYKGRLGWISVTATLELLKILVPRLFSSSLDVNKKGTAIPNPNVYSVSNLLRPWVILFLFCSYKFVLLDLNCSTKVFHGDWFEEWQQSIFGIIWSRQSLDEI